MITNPILMELFYILCAGMAGFAYSWLTIYTQADLERAAYSSISAKQHFKNGSYIVLTFVMGASFMLAGGFFVLLGFVVGFIVARKMGHDLLPSFEEELKS